MNIKINSELMDDTYSKRDWSNAILLSSLSEIGKRKLKSLANNHFDSIDINDSEKINEVVNDLYFVFSCNSNNKFSPDIGEISKSIDNKSEVFIAVMQPNMEGAPKIHYGPLSLTDLNESSADLIKDKLEEFRFPEIINVHFHNYLEHLEEINFRESHSRISENIED